MGDRIAVLKDGILQQVGTPQEMYEEPANEFVAGFIGSPAMNLGTFKVNAEGGYAELGKARVPLSQATIDALKPEDNNEIVIGFRPEALEIADESEQTIPVEIDLVEELGSDSYMYGKLVGGGGLGSGTDENPDDEASDQIIIRTAPRTAPPTGSVVHVRIREGQQHNFSKATGDRLPD